MYVLWHWAFGLGHAFGVSFLIAATLAIVRGHIFTHPLRLVLVAVGVVIGTLVIPALSGDAWQAFRRGDTVAAMILVGAVVLSWLLKRRLETGRRVVGVRPLGRRRRSPSRGSHPAVSAVDRVDQPAVPLPHCPGGMKAQETW